MTRFSILAWLMILACAQSSPGRASVAPAMADVGCAQVDGHARKLDLQLPAGISGPLPVVVCIHGGGWADADKTQVARESRAFAGAGFAAVADRLSVAAPWPAQIHDAKAALRWVGADAARLGFAPQRLAAPGARRRRSPRGVCRSPRGCRPP